jgi:concanavalin A-like lectin/glucanase superfamily protein
MKRVGTMVKTFIGEQLIRIRLAVALFALPSLILLIAGDLAAQPACVSPPAGLVSWWPFDGNANDIQGTNHGKLQNGATATATGKVGQALSLDGVDDYVAVSDAASLHLQDFTIDAWIKIGGSLPEFGANIVAYGIGGYQFVVVGSPAFGDVERSLFLGKSGFSKTFGGPVIPGDGAWHHVAVTKAGTDVTFYIDGVGSSNSFGDTFTFAGDLAIGTNPAFASQGNPPSTYAFPGFIDELEIFNRALTAIEIASIYGARSAGKCKSLCQVSVTTKWSQGVNPQTSGNGPPGGGPWGDKTYNNYNPQGGNCVQGDTSTNCLIMAEGCALTALAMALFQAGITDIPLNGQGLQPLDPGTLNQFMIEHPGDYDQSHDVQFSTTVGNIGHSLKFLPIPPSRQQSTQALDQLLCQGTPTPVIVGVDITKDLNGNPKPEHYVLVTGKQGDQYQIVDPGDHLTTALAPSDGFLIRGAVTEPQGDLSALNLAIGDAELLVVDPTGMRTGFDSTTRTILEEIPQSTHFIDSLRNDVTGAPATETSYSVPIFQPLQGAYDIVVTGLKLEAYTLSVRAFSQDGSAQPALIVQGVTAPGVATSFRIQFSSLPGTKSTVTRVATFSSTLADISNALHLGLIDNQGIANSLSSKIHAASDALSRGEARASKNILDAFTHEVSAQTGKHVTGIAPQVLLEDAASLLRQIP